MTTGTLERPLNENMLRPIVRMTVPLIASYLSKQYRVGQIATALGQKQQNVSAYIKKHYQHLMPLIDNTDALQALACKHVATKAQDQLIKVLDTCAFSDKSLMGLNAVSGTHLDKYRLLSDKSTQNVDMTQVVTNRKELQQQIIDVQARIKSLKGSEIDSKGIKS